MSGPENPNDVLAGLIDQWCERRELTALAALLPAYTSNNGLTDGWSDLWQALRTARTMVQLPDEDLMTLDRVTRQVDRIVHRS